MNEPPLPCLNWPDGIDEAVFLARHWQREPLLLRQALPDFESPLSPDELAGLALEPDTTPRLIRRETAAGVSPDQHASERFTLEHGPFDDDVFETLGPRDWSLLVTDVEKHLPELADWIVPFRLAPDWRFDDLMISYAPDGASVGAHVDEYDVFLLQASGTRRWSIERPTGGPASEGSAAPATRALLPDGFAPVRERRTIAGGDLSLLAGFEPTDSWDLVPGDVLYLPPGVPHHGVAVGENCTTWSIGFRAPSAADAFLHIAEIVAERLPHARLRDAGRGGGEPGRIDADAVAAVRSLWERATRLDEAAFVDLTGRLLTRAGAAAPAAEGWFDGDAPALPEDHRPRDAPGAPDERSAYRAAPFTRFAWTSGAGGPTPPGGGDALLFVDGDCLSCSSAFARRVCARGETLLPPPSSRDLAAPPDPDSAAFATLIERGALVPVTSPP